MADATTVQAAPAQTSPVIPATGKPPAIPSFDNRTVTYVIEKQHPKTGRKYITFASHAKSDEKRFKEYWVPLILPGWQINSVTEGTEDDARAAHAKLNETQGPGIPLDELTDGEPNAIMSRPDLADPDHTP